MGTSSSPGGTTRDGAGTWQPAMGKLQVRLVFAELVLSLSPRSEQICSSLRDAKLVARTQRCHPLLLPRTPPLSTACCQLLAHLCSGFPCCPHSVRSRQILQSHTGLFLLPGGTTPWQLKVGNFFLNNFKKKYTMMTELRSSISCKSVFPSL